MRLSVNLPVGYSFNTETIVSLIVEQEFMGIQYNTQMETGSLMNMKVNGIDADSNYILTASYQRMNIRVTSLLINMEVNSETSVKGDSLSSILQLLKGKEFRVLLNRKGEISDIIGLDEMITSTTLSTSLQDEQKFEFTRNLIQSIGKEALLDNYRGNKAFYPDYDVKASSQWDFPMIMIKNGIPMELNSHIRLKEINRNMAILVSEGRISSQSKPADNAMNLQPNQNYYLIGNEVSEIKIDTRTGLIRESIVSQNITGSIKTPSEETPSQEMTIPFKIISRSSIITSPEK
jgi:hypothetical protein